MTKRLILNLLLAGLTAGAYAQGFITLDNINNTSTNASADSNGLFWVSTWGAPALINQDFNAAFHGGTDSNSLSPIRTFLLSNGTAAYDNDFGLGTFRDPTGNEYLIPGSLFSAFFRIQAWTGNFGSYAEAVASGFAFTAQSPVFLNIVSIPPGPQVDLISMPAMILAVPEPSALGLAALAGLTWLCAYRFKTSLPPLRPL